MDWQYTDLTLFTILSSILSFGLAFYSFAKTEIRKTSSFFFLMLAVAIWSFAASMELLSNKLENKVFWSMFSYLGIATLGPLWLLFAMEFNNMLFKGSKKLFIILFSFSSLIIIATFTNTYHHLLWKATIPQVNKHGLYVEYNHGILVIINSVYTYLLFVSGISMFILNAIRDFVKYGWSTIVFVISGFFPVGINIIYMVTDNDFSKFDLTPVSFTLTGLVIYLGIFRFNIFSVLPVAYKHLFNNMSDGVIVLDQKLKLTAYNPTIEKIASLHYSNTKSIEDSMSELLSFIKDNIQNNNYQGEYICHHFNPVKYFVIQITKFSSRKKMVDNYMVVIHDITKRKNFEINLNSSQKKLEEFSYVQSKLLSIISHDFKNSLGGINNAITFLLGNPEVSDEEKNEFLVEMQKSSENIYQLLENILEWGKNKSLMMFSPTFHACETLVYEILGTIKFQAINKKINIKPTIEQGLMVYTNKHVFATIIRNLLSNAIKYSYEMGVIEINAISNNNNCQISIIDYGTGINEKVKNNLFNIESKISTAGTKNEKGSGFGLFLIKEFVDLHKGKIEVESTPGKGSTFTISFPNPLTE